MITFLDTETSFQGTGKKKDPSPFNPLNKLVSCGWLNESEEDYVCFNHSTEPQTKNGREALQSVLDMTTVLVAHNVKFDLQWLWETNFVYDGAVHCTMLTEYIMARGVRMPLGLDDCCERYKLETKDSRIKYYMDNDISFENIPWTIVKEYGIQDVRILKQLFKAQLDRLNTEEKDVILLYNNS